MSERDGGAAFPQPIAVSAAGDVYYSGDFGMSLRDWFAGQALSGILASSETALLFSSAVVSRMDMARSAYEFADFMLAARKQEPKE